MGRLRRALNYIPVVESFTDGGIFEGPVWDGAFFDVDEHDVVGKIGV